MTTIQPTPAENAAPHSPFTHTLLVGEDAIDQNGHVNNVVYIQWMQDVAILHSHHCGGTQRTHDLGCSWVVRSHQIDYLRPAFAGETIVASTWVADFGKVRSLRKYAFFREKDNSLLARGQTDWVFIEQASGRPRAIPEEVRRCYPLLPDHVA